MCRVKEDIFMNRKYWLALLMIGMAICLSGCGYDIAEDTTVTVVRATPTPSPAPTPTPAPATPTPTPIPFEQTASGVNIRPEANTYYTTAGINLRSDCSTESQAVGSVMQGVQLEGTGVSEDGKWIRVNYNGTTVYVSADYVTTTAPAQ